MKAPTLFGFLFSSLALSAWSQSLDSLIAEQSAAARAILDPWQTSNPKPADRRLHLVYWTPLDREPCPDFRARLTRMLDHIQDFYAREMKRNGFGECSIRLRKADDDQLIIHLVRGRKPYSAYDRQSGNAIKQESDPALRAAGIDPDRETVMIFCNMANWDEEKKILRHNSPYYAGGNARAGRAWQLDSPILDTKRLTDTKTMMQDGEYGRISMGKHNSIFIGGIAHELGHALGLPHCRARPDEATAFGTALMGAGNRSYADEVRQEGRGSFLTFAHALRLASHPQFSGSVKSLNLPNPAKIKDLKIKPGAKTFAVAGRIESQLPGYGIIAYIDPEDGSDYDSLTLTAIPDAEGRFTMDFEPYLPDGFPRRSWGKSAQLRLVACQVNGSTVTRRIGFRIEPDARTDFSAFLTRQALEPLLGLLNTRGSKPEAIAKVIASVPAEAQLARRIAARLTGSSQQNKLSPAECPAETKIIPLSDTAPETSQVGWGRPVYDRVPEAGVLLESGGRVFEHGFYAHAPASHVYPLGKKWKSLEGFAGISNDRGGSVGFSILVDGKEKWRSKGGKDKGLSKYRIDLNGADRLELRVDDARDGNTWDWGLWLEPTLSR